MEWDLDDDRNRFLAREIDHGSLFSLGFDKRRKKTKIKMNEIGACVCVCVGVSVCACVRVCVRV